MLNLRTFEFLSVTSRRRLRPGVGTLTFMVWAAVAFSAVAWGLHWSSGPLQAAVDVDGLKGLAEPDPQLVARALGGVQTSVARADAASRLRLVGVLSERESTWGIALLSVDGQPAKPFRVGQTVTDGLVLQATHVRQALLGAQLDGAPSVTLELPRNK